MWVSCADVKSTPLRGLTLKNDSDLGFNSLANRLKAQIIENRLAEIRKVTFGNPKSFHPAVASE